MPRIYRRRKTNRKPRTSRPRRRYARRMRPRTKTGMLRIVRKCPEILLTNTTVAGVFNINDPTGNMLASTGSGVATGFLGTYDIPFSMKFSLNQILNSSEITTIADKYRLVKTVVRIYFNSNQVSVQSQTSLPQCTYIVDTDDAAIPTVAQVREKMGAKIRYFNNKNFMQITLYPKPTQQIFNSGITTAYGPGYRGYIDANNPAVEHYGLKAVFQNVMLPATANSTGFKFDVEHTIVAKDLQ